MGSRANMREMERKPDTAFITRAVVSFDTEQVCGREMLGGSLAPRGPPDVRRAKSPGRCGWGTGRR